jgi:bifunctional polynucleotide phosphatase/kinase
MADSNPGNSLKRKASDSRGDISPPSLKRNPGSGPQTTQKGINSFFAPRSQKEPALLRWASIEESVLRGRYLLDGPSETPQVQTKPHRIAAFDYDSTLVENGQGSQNNVKVSDWRWWHRTVPITLRKLHAEGYEPS